ncbi:TIGR03086 family metal-binding protein [Modestobacter sp. VKM Ac-2977]|uniref:TIGR03086 family metal-binding protein n=1 Tax=Modestobacter sp. VKM Ac-2977 TaxID=3004131 RepID=UPI0022AA0C04|nr:TIGR03086 family metal-binding protein [Modestobacter sp. VKM Ac-2977]MCZ2819984.1 TIGR03086 family metal-binding protein [Modestobacter sp. VKM Ac-2977]
MTSTATSFAAADRPLTALLDTVPPTGWSRPSPCEGWTAADVVGHVIGTQREFLSTHGVDLGEAPDVAADPAAAWRAHAQRVTEAVSDDAVASREFDGFFGRTTVGAAFEQFYVWDMVVHRWDVARAVGAEDDLTDEELDRVEAGADGFGDALHMEGICRPALDVPADADREARLLARLGRVA